MIRYRTLTLLVCGLLAGCVGAPPPSAHQAAAVRKPAQAPAHREDEASLWAHLGSLPGQKVPPHSCGLFLWANIPNRSLVFFADNSTPTGTIMYDGKPVKLPLVAATGTSMLGLFSDLHYETDHLSLTVSYSAQTRPGLSDGVVVTGGTWRLREKGGWELVLPVVGLIGCA
ncbi:hypothetical protein [Kordiimonas marina]|uniref:hypothetical protein n=1 Tax=Kordiimonas marina TaxID=2872312 RepID=UPI001FF44B73|nr:hypothetical protein [Kordiimonas marina]MCJ9430055.1 hypothetical protein [Kordiimonas marina]